MASVASPSPSPVPNKIFFMRASWWKCGDGKAALYRLLPDNMNSVWRVAHMGRDSGKSSFHMTKYFMSTKHLDEAAMWVSAGAWQGNHNCMLLLAEQHRSGYDGKVQLSTALNYYTMALNEKRAFDPICADALAKLQEAFPEVKA